MPVIEVIILICYLALCAGLAWYLRQRYQFFRTYKGFLTLFLIGLAGCLVHNGIYGLWEVEEVFTFFVGTIFLGTFFFNFIYWLISIIKVLTSKK